MGAYEQQDSCFISTTINPISLQPLIIAPTPSTSGLLSFALPDLEGESGRLSIYSSHGKLVHQQVLTIVPSNTLQLRQLPSGTYFVVVQAGDRVFSGKWVLAK